MQCPIPEESLCFGKRAITCYCRGPPEAESLSGCLLQVPVADVASLWGKQFLRGVPHEGRTGEVLRHNDPMDVDALVGTGTPQGVTEKTIEGLAGDSQ